MKKRGKTLGEWMRAYKLTDADVASITGLHRTSVWKYRKGERRPRPDIVTKLVRMSRGVITRHALRPDIYPRDFS